ncbi:MAG: patatin-like phospholipase family protein [Verrucomicrobiota bacterium]
MKWFKKWVGRTVLPAIARTTGFPMQIPSSQIREYSRGEVVCRVRQIPDGIYLILSGKCEVSEETAGGRRHVTGILSAGDTFGQQEIMQSKISSCTLRVLETSTILCLSPNDLNDLLSKKPELSDQLADTRAAKYHQPVQLEILRDHFGKVALWVCLDDAAPDEELFKNFQKLLSNEVSNGVLWIKLDPEGFDLKQWDQYKAAETKVVALNEHIEACPFSIENKCLRLKTPSSIEALKKLRSLFGFLSKDYDYILFHLPYETDTSIVLEAAVHASLGYVVVGTQAQKIYEFNLLLNELRNLMQEEPSHIKPVYYCTSGLEMPELRHSEIPDYAERHCVHEFKVEEVEDSMDQPSSLEMQRMAREISGNRLGLALSSGGAKGLAHIGVIQVLEENGIEIDLLAGSSMGAYIAALWGYGLSGQEMQPLANELESGWQKLGLLDPVFPPRRGFIKGLAVKKRLQRTIGKVRFSEMARPVRIIGTRLDTLETVVFSRGDVAQAVHASVAVPGVCAPVKIDGVDYVDGGIADPMPVDILRNMGIEKVIAVNTLPTPEILKVWSREHEQQYEAPGNSRKGNMLLRTLGRQLNYFAYGNILNTMMRSVHGVQMRIAQKLSEDADLVLDPIQYDAHWTDFSNPTKYIELGRKVTEIHLDEIKALTKPQFKTEKHNESRYAERKVGSLA